MRTVGHTNSLGVLSGGVADIKIYQIKYVELAKYLNKSSQTINSLWWFSCVIGGWGNHASVIGKSSF